MSHVPTRGGGAPPVGQVTMGNAGAFLWNGALTARSWRGDPLPSTRLIKGSRQTGRHVTLEPPPRMPDPARNYSFPEFEAGAHLPRFLRWFTYAVVLVLGASAVLDFIGVDQAESDQASHAEALNLAGRQRMLSQRLAFTSGMATVASRQAGRAPMRRAAASEAMVTLETERARLEALDLFRPRLDDVPALQPLRQAHDRWRAALLASPEGGPDAVRALDELTVLTEAFLPAMNRVLHDMQEQAAAGQSRTRHAHAVNMSLLVLVVAAFTLAAGEWLARRLTRQQARALMQATELERLALVAERTHNAVIISDERGRVVWANDGFTRISGYPLHEVIGRRPGSLVQFEGTDQA